MTTDDRDRSRHPRSTGPGNPGRRVPQEAPDHRQPHGAPHALWRAAWKSSRELPVRERTGGRGCRPPDDRILGEVLDAIAIAADVAASHLDVAVADGEVTLHGTVLDRRAKRRIEDVAGAVPGVRDVHNRLRLPPSSHRST